MRGSLIRAKQAQPSLSVIWANFDGASTVYETLDPTVNTITLTIQNATTSGLTFNPGPPVEEGAARPAGQSVLYLDFEGLLPNDCIAAVDWQATDWTLATYVDEEGLQYLALAPQRTLQLAIGETLTFFLSNITVEGVRDSSNCVLSFDGVTGLPDALAECQIFINVQKQPVKGDRPLNVVIELSETNLVVADGLPHDLQLSISNINHEPLVPGGGGAWKRTPTFQLDFVYGDGPGALTTRDQAASISVSTLNAYGNIWKPVRLLSEGRYPYWQMQPNSNGGGQVLGSGANASISFLISGVTTRQLAGVTLAYVSYRDIPGFDDGFIALEILKVDQIVIDFTATPDAFVDPKGPCAVTLKFVVDGASYVSISNTTYGRSTNGLALIDSVDVTISETTTFVLEAVDAASGQRLTRAITVKTPQLLSFTSNVTGPIWLGQTVDLTWSSECSQADLALYAIGPNGVETFVGSQPASHSLTVTPQAPTTYVAKLQTQRIPTLLLNVPMTPVQVTLTASPPGPYSLGDKVTVAATVTGASSFSLDKNQTTIVSKTTNQMTTTASVNVVMDSSLGQNPPITYTLTAQGYGGPVTSTVTLALTDSNARLMLQPGEWLDNWNYIISETGKFYLVLQSDGNLCLYQTPVGPAHGPATWQSGSAQSQSGPFHFIFQQDDGNLCIYGGVGTPNPIGPLIFNAGTNQQGGTLLTVGDDGKVTLYNGANQAIWVRPISDASRSGS